jgi:RNA polymerase sigma-70 factor (ECF subfamily)
MVPPQDDARSRSFKTTPWSLLFATRGRDLTEAQRAVAELCEIYWRPIYSYITGSGYDLYDAQDLTQAFMLYLIDREAFAKADKAKGKFRSYLLGILNHFLIHAHRAERAQKRGGGAEALPLDEAVLSEIETPATSGGPLPPPDPGDREWALAIQGRVDDRIAAEYAAAEKSELYLTLRRHLTSEKSAGSYKDDARRLGRPVATIRSDVSRMRQRYTELVLEELRRDAPRGDLQEELFHYCHVIAFL